MKSGTEGGVVKDEFSDSLYQILVCHHSLEELDIRAMRREVEMRMKSVSCYESKLLRHES